MVKTCHIGFDISFFLQSTQGFIFDRAYDSIPFIFGLFFIKPV